MITKFGAAMFNRAMQASAPKVQSNNTPLFSGVFGLGKGDGKGMSATSQPKMDSFNAKRSAESDGA